MWNILITYLNHISSRCMHAEPSDLQLFVMAQVSRVLDGKQLIHICKSSWLQECQRKPGMGLYTECQEKQVETGKYNTCYLHCDFHCSHFQIISLIHSVFLHFFTSEKSGFKSFFPSDRWHHRCPPPLLAFHHTIVSEPEPFPVKKSQKFAVGDGLLSSCGVCLTQMLLSMEPLRLEQLPPLREKLSAEVRPGPRRSWALSASWLWSLGVEVEDEEEKQGWDRLSRLWWEWNWRMWRMDLPGGTSPAGPRAGHGFWTGNKTMLLFHFLCPTLFLMFQLKLIFILDKDDLSKALLLFWANQRWTCRCVSDHCSAA